MPETFARDTVFTAGRYLRFHPSRKVFASFDEVIGSSFIRSTYLATSRDITYSIMMDGRLLSSTNMWWMTAFSQRLDIMKKQRYARAAQLVREWLKDESGHDETTWPVLERELRKGRIQFGE